MAKTYFRITEVVRICGVSKRFVLLLERENLIRPVTRGREKLYPLRDLDRIRVAQLLFHDMGVNLEGIEVALHMRDQIIAMRRRLEELMAQARARPGL
ncbi:MAG TPA: chaperone modulator CbpM [Candidatus Eisenbacteria bacterium]|nr:chaperone modulator CbpM [Candidatus Eisenbacteria bacterium]